MRARGGGPNNRSVMPLDVLGCTRATMKGGAGPGVSWVRARPFRAGDGWWESVLNEEYLVGAGH